MANLYSGVIKSNGNYIDLSVETGKLEINIAD